MIVKIQQPIAIHELGKRQNQEDAIYPALDKATTVAHDEESVVGSSFI